MKSLRDHFLRIDARSLGLFRVTFALVLVADLFARWRWLRDFYSNEGVLPNHNHLFNLRDKQQVFSVFHAFSSPGEAHFAFGVTLLVYLFFLVGYRTRLFHILSLVLLVSLTSRNVLAENSGNYAAIALLLFTAFLPCGSRLSLDSLRASMARRDEKGAADLNDRAPPSASAITAGRLPGWSPTSIAALAVLVQLAIIYVCTALQQSGEAWRDGTAFHYALHVDRWVTGAGAWVRGALPAGSLGGLTRGFHAVQLVIPALLFVPVFYRWTRGLAAALMVLHGVVLGVLFDVGLFGWALAASAPLVLPPETWGAIERSWREKRARTVIYDADCGVCLWLARVLKRLDLRGQLTFQGNDDLDELLARGPGGTITRRPMPAEVTLELTDQTVVVIDGRGRVATRGRAVTETLMALPLGWLAWPLRLPGISHALDAAYKVFSPRRQAVSVLVGKGACGVTPPDDEGPESARGGRSPDEVAPALRVARFASGALREAAVLVAFAAMLAQTAKENPVPEAIAVPQGKVLAGVASWPRMLARWDLMAPEPPRENGVMIVDGQTRAGVAVDPLTGEEPLFDMDARGPTGMGPLWADYVDRARRKEWSDFQRVFRDYLGKGGSRWPREPKEVQITGLDAYWVSRPIPPPGAEATGDIEKEKLFTYSRGGSGKIGIERMPLRRPLRKAD